MREIAHLQAHNMMHLDLRFHYSRKYDFHIYFPKIGKLYRVNVIVFFTYEGTNKKTAGMFLSSKCIHKVMPLFTVGMGSF